MNNLILATPMVIIGVLHHEEEVSNHRNIHRS